MFLQTKREKNPFLLHLKHWTLAPFTPGSETCVQVSLCKCAYMCISGFHITNSSRWHIATQVFTSLFRPIKRALKMLDLLDCDQSETRLWQWCRGRVFFKTQKCQPFENDHKGEINNCVLFWLESFRYQKRAVKEKAWREIRKIFNTLPPQTVRRYQEATDLFEHHMLKAGCKNPHSAGSWMHRTCPVCA